MGWRILPRSGAQDGVCPMILFKSVSGVGVLVSFLACSAVHNVNESTSNECSSPHSGWDAAVLEVVTREAILPDPKVKSDPQVILYSTTASVHRLASRMRSTDALIQQLRCRNLERSELSSFLAGPRVRFVTSPERERLFQQVEDEPSSAWAVFYSVFENSHGFFSLTQPAYNESGTEALVYLEWQGGELAASGRLIRLKRRGSQWRVVNSKTLWIS